MKLAIIDPVGSKAGMDRYDLRLAEALRLIGLPVLVFTDVADPASGPSAAFRFQLHRNTISFFSLLFLFIKVLRQCQREKVTHVLVHVFAFSAVDEWLLRRIRANGFRALTLVHDVNSFVKATSSARQNRILLQLSDHVLVHNQRTADELNRLTGGSTTITVIPHGHFIDSSPATVDRSAARKRLGIPLSAYCPLFFGMIKPTKGLLTLCEAMEILPSDIMLLVAGRPRGSVNEELAHLKRLQDSDKACTKIGYVPPDEMELWMAAADCVVIPYERSYQSGVAIQAMSRGIPVILSDLPVHRDWVSYGAAAQLFIKGDKEALASAILRWKNDPDEAGRTAGSAKDRILREHAWELPAGIILNLLRNA
jgi:glycosyltransferase involved in cell wall biosynthesis